MTSLSRRRVAVATTATAITGLLAAAGLGALPASAATSGCPGTVRTAATSNTVYVSSGSIDLPQLATACGVKPAMLADLGGGVWHLKANIRVENGATLNIHGTKGGAVAAHPVGWLKLESPPSGLRKDVVEISAQAGKIDIRATKITSWVAAANGVDTDPSVPAAAGADGKGRAFLRAVSLKDANGKNLVSRMDIADSELSYLGYHGGEAYGVSYKARGCGATAAEQKVCAELDVLGSQRNSVFDHNYFGTYTWGAEGMVFDRNVYSNNVMYGLDPHDDSDNLKITNNQAFGNGTHGIICSQRCNDLEIVGNVVHDNGNPPHLPDGDTDPTDNQVHGIMLHRGVTRALVANNVVDNHVNGAGIAVFDSMKNTIRDNKITNAKYGLRVSVGSADNTFTRNVVTNSTSHGVYAYPGVKDKSQYANPSTSHPIRNTFTDNTFNGARLSLVNLLGSDGFTFSGTTVTGTVGPIVADGSSGLLWRGSPVPSTSVQLRNGSKGRVVVGAAGSFPLSMDSKSGLEVWSPGGLLANVSGLTLYSTVSDGGSLLTIPGTNFGLAPRTVTVNNASAATAVGTLSARPGGLTTPTKRIVVRSSSKKAKHARYRLARLTPAGAYVVTVNGKVIAAKKATKRGTLSFVVTRKGSARQTIVVRPAG